MTKKLYMESDNTTELATVACCISEGEHHIAILDKTIFHPQGGGQPSDQGYLGGARVLSVKERDGAIEHYLDTPVSPGLVELKVDEDIRALHSVLHTIGHLIGNIGDSFGWAPVKAHHWPRECKVEFLPTNESEHVTADQFQTALMALIEKGLNQKNQIDESGTRLVGFGDLNPWPCGGTHVDSLAKLPPKISVSVKTKRERMIVRYEVDHVD